jgi:hypothetical protein
MGRRDGLRGHGGNGSLWCLSDRCGSWSLGLLFERHRFLPVGLLKGLGGGCADSGDGNRRFLSGGGCRAHEKFLTSGRGARCGPQMRIDAVEAVRVAVTVASHGRSGDCAGCGDDVPLVVGIVGRRMGRADGAKGHIRWESPAW